MPDDSDSTTGQPIGDFREITLRIPGECFFCETIKVRFEEESKGGKSKNYDPVFNSVIKKLGDPHFSPYPIEQLAWGYHYCEKSKTAIIFASPFVRLRQLGWQNLELFRRVFPSFVSLFCQEYESPVSVYLLCNDSLSLACFEPNSSVPRNLFSVPVDSDDQDSIQRAKAKLLSLINPSRYKLSRHFLIAGDIVRTTDNLFVFHHSAGGEADEAGEKDLSVRLPAEELWRHDLRSVDFKTVEKNRRKNTRARWRVTNLCALAGILMGTLFIGLKVVSTELVNMGQHVDEMKRQAPLVIKSRELLKKLRQQKLGGIDPFYSIGRLAGFRGSTLDSPHVWFTEAHFESRNHIKLEGEGRNVEAINTFLANLKKAKVARIKTGRSGEDLRKIKSGGGETTFEIQLETFEDSNNDSQQTQSIEQS